MQTTIKTMVDRNRRRGVFVKYVLEQPSIAHAVMSKLSAKDRVSFAGVSNVTRFKEATDDFVAEARVVINMDLFIADWNGYIETCQQECWEDISDRWLYDNVVRDHYAYLAHRLNEWCVYLRANWRIIRNNGLLEYTIRRIVNEMRDVLPAQPRLTADTFIDDVNQGRLEG
jgi:hypothetical protein